MSFYFNIESEKKITYRQLTDSLQLEQLSFDHVDNLDELIGADNRKLFIKNKSTRGVNLHYRNANYSIGLNVISSETDFDIALKIEEAIANLTQAPILPEDMESPIDLTHFKNKYDRQWVGQQQYSGVNIFIEKIGNDGDLLAIGCCYMDYYIGPNIHKNLDSSSEKAYYDGLVNCITSTQFWDREQYQTPSIIHITEKETGAEKKIIVLYPGGNQFLTKADILIIANGNDRVELPYEKIAQLTADQFRLVDEQQFLVEALTPEEYHLIYLQARAIVMEQTIESTTALNNPTNTQKKWWEFWK